ncbi:family 43 glycosylhydrolase [Cohnella sp. CFH 77786]|uniref:glycoside hydrolase family 43 protein n=1 Tax=Cohnella sp. CFH 77786 TaxID=2662265 RepID=UPI001C60DB08|nr:glycoside hydrolase family 43 protein [Cohnella sp. CFH 77786]MBW5445732.1 family 43 glycosylhydrolase [Cohnella sp. CFH 77786]
MATYRNPVIPGFYPDPTVARAGDTFYLATSSFEYFPGVPIFRSTDLVSWEPIGHALTRRSQVDFRNRGSSDGIYAPTLRYHGGLFYLITTDVRGRGNFFVRASDPAGPWSDPVKLPYGNIDPSLLFDDDGRVYVTAQNGWEYESHIIQYEIDPETGEALTEPKVIFEGDEGPWTEGPHLYKIRGMYYLLCASGGTGFGHREIAARSANPYGPFEPRPEPILTHSGLRDHPFQCLGHADLFQDGNGDWWAVFLGTRPTEGGFSVLGRETFLAPVRWTEDGWPYIDDDEGIVRPLMTVARLPGTPSHEAPVLPPGNAYRLGSGFDANWSFLRDYDESRFSWTDRPGWLAVTGNVYTLADNGGPAVFACLRQKHRSMAFSCRLDFIPQAQGEEAGLAARLNHNGFCVFGIKRTDDGVPRISLTYRDGPTDFSALYDAAPEEACYLSVRSDAAAYGFSYSPDGRNWRELPARLPASALSPERNGGFTGVCIGMYASGNGQPSATPAYFSGFRYDPAG